MFIVRHMMIIFNSHMMIMVLLELKSCICHCVLALCGAKVQAFILDKQRTLSDKIGRWIMQGHGRAVLNCNYSHPI